MCNPPLRMQHCTMLGMHEPGGRGWGQGGGGVKRTTVGLLTSFLISLARVCCLLLKYPLILYDFVIVLLAPLNPAAASSFLYDSSFCAIFGNYWSRGKIAAVDNTVKLPPLVSTYSQPPRSFLLVAVAARRLIIPICKRNGLLVQDLGV